MISSKSIYELEDMLKEAGIPHEMRMMDGDDNTVFGYQIVYPSLSEWMEEKAGSGDVVCNEISYGHEQDLLEAMGFDIPGSDVEGFLTAQQAFEYFERQYRKDRESR